MTRVRNLIRNEGGYSLVELIVVMATLAVILGGLTTAFVQGSRAELHTNRRVQAQLNAMLAFDKLRRDVHCASSASISGATMTLSGCAGGTVSWCAVGSGSRYTVYRKSGATCDSAGHLWADYLSTSSIFTYTASVADISLAKVHADFRVNVSPPSTVDSFELADDIVLRNSSR